MTTETPERAHLAEYIEDLGTPKTKAQAIAERNAWVESAVHFSCGEEYYRGLLDQIAAHIGPEAWKADNGDDVGSVVRARLPDLVEARLSEARVEVLREALAGVLPFLRHNGLCAAIGGYDCGCTCGRNAAEAAALAALASTPTPQPVAPQPVDEAREGLVETIKKIERKAFAGSDWNKRGGNSHNDFAEIIQICCSALARAERGEGL